MNENLQLLQKRHSVRSFTDEPLQADHLKKLKATVTMINTHQHGLKFQLITEDPDALTAFSKSYGVFRNAVNYLAAVADTATPNASERAGYYAEQFVIKAQTLGLGTCFVGGTYDKDKVKAQLRAGEKILFLVLIGYPDPKEKALAKLLTKIVHRKKMSICNFFQPENELEEASRNHPELQDGLAAVACAPSSLNKRPVRIFQNPEGEICAEVGDKNPKDLIDLGIAKYNYNFATSTECEWGNGAPLTGGDTLL